MGTADGASRAAGGGAGGSSSRCSSADGPRRVSVRRTNAHGGLARADRAHGRGSSRARPPEVAVALLFQREPPGLLGPRPPLNDHLPCIIINATVERPQL